MRISRKSSGWKLPLYTWRNSGRHPAGRLGFFHDRAGLSKYLTQTFMSHGNEMICQPVTLSGYAEWPKVADAVIEAEPLTNPTAYGASASDAFDLVIPSMPGYGFSGKPTSPGWGPERMGQA